VEARLNDLKSAVIQNEDEKWNSCKVFSDLTRNPNQSTMKNKANSNDNEY